MADEFNFTRLGQANLSGDAAALFRDTLIPEILTQFDAKRVMKNYVRTKTVKNAKSATFPVLGTTNAKYVTVGDSLLGNQSIAHNEITINLDPFLVSDILIHDLDVKLQAYDDRAEIAAEMAKALANTEDKQLLQVGVLAARAAGTVQGRAGGTVLKAGASVKTDAAVLAGSIYTAGVELDEKNVDEEGRYCFVRPLQYAMLAQYEDIKNHDIGSGSYADGTTGKLNNIQIIKTNHLPDKNIAQSEDTAKPNNIYYGDFTNTAALVMTKQAIGTVSRQGLIVEPKWILERLSHLLTARILQGHGILRPECAVEISAAA
jgi:HK97 family phage major capsid protein